jgi:hypothetical protein
MKRCAVGSLKAQKFSGQRNHKWTNGVCIHCKLTKEEVQNDN